MGFTIRHFHYTRNMDERQGSRLAYFKVYDGDTLVAVVAEPDHMNLLNAAMAKILGTPASAEEQALSVRCDERNQDNDALRAFLGGAFKGRTFNFQATPNWTWNDDPNGAEEMPWGASG